MEFDWWLNCSHVPGDENVPLTPHVAESEVGDGYSRADIHERVFLFVRCFWKLWGGGVTQAFFFV